MSISSKKKKFNVQVPLDFNMVWILNHFAEISDDCGNYGEGREGK